MIRRHPLLIKEKSAVGRICKFRLPMGEIPLKIIFYENQYLLSSAGFGARAQLIGPIQLHVKRQNSSICKFFQDIAWTFFCL